MISYSSFSSNKRNLAAIRDAGWRIMISPYTHHMSRFVDCNLPYAIDNGAWSAYVRQQRWMADDFLRLLSLYGSSADFVVLPDIIAGGLRSLEFSLLWRQLLARACPQLLAVQDGIEPKDITGLIGPGLGIFIGGTTEWKERTMKSWGELARKQNAYLHVGRVNTARRIRLAHAYGAHSIDGSSVSRYAVTLPELDRAIRQHDLWGRRF